MTFLQIRTLVEKFVQYDLATYTDPAAVSYTDDLKSVVNWALRLCSQSLYLYGAVPLNPATNDQALDLADSKFTYQMLTIEQVQAASTFLRDPSRKLGVWPSAMFLTHYPGYLTATAGQPEAATVMNGQLVFDKKHDATSQALSWQVVGRYLAPSLVNDADVPLIPLHCHEAIAQVAAIRFVMPNLDEAAAWQRMGQFAQDAGEILVAEFRRSYRAVHGFDPVRSLMRDQCAVFRYVDAESRDARGQ